MSACLRGRSLCRPGELRQDAPSQTVCNYRRLVNVYLISPGSDSFLIFIRWTVAQMSRNVAV